MKHVIIFDYHTNPKKIDAIHTFLRGLYPITHMGKAGEGNGYFADNWQVVWKTPKHNPPDEQGLGYRKWHVEFDDDELHTLLVLKGLL